jgi:DNA-3-methyladenine glycosylase
MPGHVSKSEGMSELNRNGRVDEPEPDELVPLPRRFYVPSARDVAPKLLGHWLVRRTDSGLSGGRIVETEAYLREDPACHGYRGMTRRNAAIFGPPGRAYVYFIYGNHWCFNAVCQGEGIGEAVLIRAIEPAFGLDWMAKRRPGREMIDWTNGPGKFCQALDIDRALDGTDLTSTDSPLFIARNLRRDWWITKTGPVTTTVRIGITAAADWPLRFFLAGSRWVSGRRLPFGKPGKGGLTAGPRPGKSSDRGSPPDDE